MTKEKIQHRVLLLFLTSLVVGGIAVFLNHVSFDPDFSVIDAMSGATKKSHHEDQGSVAWSYTRDDIALADTAGYAETEITVGEQKYLVLRKESDKKNLVMLSSQENVEYQAVVKKIAEEMEAEGYHVQIRTYSETMMLSMAHAGRFDLFLMREETKE